MEIYATRNNIVEEYHHGNAGKEGLRAMINILKEELGLEGIYDEIMTTLALHLGSVDLQKLFAVLGHTIDCSNMKKTLRRLKRKQGDLGVMPALQRESLRQAAQARTGSTHTVEAKQKMSQARTGSTHTEETKQKMKGRTSSFLGKTHTEEAKQKMSQARLQLTEQVKADRNGQFDKYIQENQLVEGEMSTICWDRSSTKWDVRLRQKHFGRRTRVGYFKRLSYATAAMKRLDEALKDKSKREDETFVNEVIEHVKREFNAGTKGEKWKRSDLENIL